MRKRPYWSCHTVTHLEQKIMAFHGSSTILRRQLESIYVESLHNYWHHTAARRLCCSSYPFLCWWPAKTCWSTEMTQRHRRLGVFQRIPTTLFRPGISAEDYYYGEIWLKMMNNELSNFEIFEGISWKYALHMVPVSQSQHDAIVVSNSQTHMAVMVCFKVSLGGIMFFWGTELDSPHHELFVILCVFVFWAFKFSGVVQHVETQVETPQFKRAQLFQTPFLYKSFQPKTYIFLKPQTVYFQFKRTRNLRSVRLAANIIPFSGQDQVTGVPRSRRWVGFWPMKIHGFLHVLLELK